MLYHLKVFVTPFSQQTDQCIEEHRHDAEQYDAHQKPIHFEDLAGVDNEVSESVSCGQEFSDDDAYQAKADIDFHVADDRGDGTWNYDF